MEITAEAGIGKIAESVSASVLLGDDVLDLKWREDVGLGEMAVFAPSDGALPDFLLDSLVHPRSLEFSVLE